MTDLLAAAGVVVHRLADAFPMITPVDWPDFRNDVARNGIVEPVVWSHDGLLVDGRNRLTAWLELGNALGDCPSTVLAADADVDSLIVSWNIARRHMTTGQRAAAAAVGYDYYADAVRPVGRPANNADKLIGIIGDARDVAGAAFNVSPAYVDRARRVMRDKPALFSELQSGALTLNAAWSKLNPATASVSVDTVAQPEREIPVTADAIRTFFRNESLDLVTDLLAELLFITESRHSSVSPAPFTRDDLNALNAGRRAERADRIAANAALYDR